MGVEADALEEEEEKEDLGTKWTGSLEGRRDVDYHNSL